jgi:hypothetical protein
MKGTPKREKEGKKIQEGNEEILYQMLWQEVWTVKIVE